MILQTGLAVQHTRHQSVDWCLQKSAVIPLLCLMTIASNCSHATDLNQLRKELSSQSKVMTTERTSAALSLALNTITSRSQECFFSVECSTEYAQAVRNCVSDSDWRSIFELLAPLRSGALPPPQVRQAAEELLLAIVEGRGPLPTAAGHILDITSIPTSEAAILTLLGRADVHSTTTAKAALLIASDSQRQLMTRQVAIRKLAAGEQPEFVEKLKADLQNRPVELPPRSDHRLRGMIQALPAEIDRAVEDVERRKHVEPLPGEAGAQQMIQEYLLSSAIDGERSMGTSVEPDLMGFLSKADIQSTTTQRAAVLFAVDSGRGKALREHALNRLVETGRVELVEEVQALLAKRRQEGGTTPTFYSRNQEDVAFEKEVDGLVLKKLTDLRSPKNDNKTTKTVVKVEFKNPPR